MQLHIPRRVCLIFLFALKIRILYNVTVARAYTAEHDSEQYMWIGMHFVQDHCYCLHYVGSTQFTTLNRAPIEPLLILFAAAGIKRLYTLLDQIREIRKQKNQKLILT